MKRATFYLCVCAALAGLAANAMAQTDPDPPRSSFSSSYVAVQGQTAGIPDNCSDGRCGSLVVTVRDFSNTPIAGSQVVIDFSGCSDIQVACDQLNAVTGQAYIGGKRVMVNTNALGQATFRVLGAANAVPPVGGVSSPGTNAGVRCAQVYADGAPLGGLIVAAYDINGLGSPGAAVNSADVSLVVSEALIASSGGESRARDDYNNTNTVNAGDAFAASQMALQAALGTGSLTTGPFCP